MDQEYAWYGSYPETARAIGDSPPRHKHLAEVIRVAAKNYPDRPAVSTQLPNGACTTLKFKDVDRLSADFAVYLREALDIQPGETVALMSPNCIGFLVAAFGIFSAGCVCTNINPLYTAPEMEHQLRDSDSRVLVIADLFGDKVDAVISNTPVKHVVRISLVDFFPAIKKALLDFGLKRIKKAVPKMRSGHVSMGQALRQGRSLRMKSKLDIEKYYQEQKPDDTALYQYTGGTTGRSKGAVLTHANILSNAATTVSLIEESMNPDRGDCCIVALPLYHITAFVLVMLPSLVNGSHAIMIPSPRPPLNLKPAFERHKITHFSGINTLFAALLEEPWCSRETLQHLKLCSSGGAAQQVSVADRWKALTGLEIYQGYGLTECAGCLTLNPLGGNRFGFAGIPIPQTVVKIVDDEGQEVPAGVAGEVIAKGPSIMKGYLNRPKETTESLKDGWLYTGDIGTMDAIGYLQIVDRKKDMVLVSGFNVYPNEIEDVIAGMTGVSEVGVVGVPDEKTGEAVKAFVVSSDPGLTAEQVIAHCTGTLTNYKRPKHVEFVTEIPKSPVGKVLRRNLRELDQP